ncbi:MAG: tetratricopeptide repeat protein [Candidatus Latescibacteria bacterium]|nr:tetratricopeptide repeat protein [Candidatus Latescibacterota bacterium]
MPVKRICLYCLLLLAFFAINVRSAETEKTNKSIAVIAFENTMKDENLDWIGVGFSETITTKLAHVKTLVVVERRHIEKALQEMELGSTGLVDDKTAQHAGKMIGAQYLLVGSFQKFDASTGALLMVNSRIMEVETSQIFETFMIRGKYDDMFDLQEQLALKVSALLDIPLTVEEKSKLAETESASLKAYEYFYRGKHASDIDEKIGLYEQAIEIDPQYVYALTNLGSLYYVKSMDGDRSMLNKAKDLCTKALDIDPLHADAHYVLGSVYDRQNKKKNALQHLNSFLQLMPDDPRVPRVKRRIEKLESD